MGKAGLELGAFCPVASPEMGTESDARCLGTRICVSLSKRLNLTVPDFPVVVMGQSGKK